MKQKYVANSKREFKFSAWPVLAFGYYSQYANFDKYNVMSIQTIYLLFFKLTATQIFLKSNES